MSSNYQCGLIQPPIFPIALLEIISNCLKTQRCNEVENLHLVFPWQHLIFKCVTRLPPRSLWLISSLRASSGGQEQIWHAWHSGARAQTHTRQRGGPRSCSATSRKCGKRGDVQRGNGAYRRISHPHMAPYWCDTLFYSLSLSVSLHVISALCFPIGHVSILNSSPKAD